MTSVDPESITATLTGASVGGVVQNPRPSPWSGTTAGRERLGVVERGRPRRRDERSGSEPERAEPPHGTVTTVERPGCRPPPGAQRTR